jgi:hypothetical protein
MFLIVTCVDNVAEHIHAIINRAIPSLESKLSLALVDGQFGCTSHYCDHFVISKANVALNGRRKYSFVSTKFAQIHFSVNI